MTANGQASVAREAITSEPTTREAASTLVDARRLPRLVVSMGVALVFLGAAAVALSRIRSAVPVEKKRTTVVVALTEPTVEKPPPPVPTVETPDVVPDRAPQKPTERPAAQAISPAKAPLGADRGGGSGEAGTDDGTDPYQGGLGPSTPAPPNPTPSPPAPPPSPPRPAPVAPEAQKPVRVTEDVEAPVPISMGAPGYPEGAKSAGVEGTVVIQYVVTETGAVTSVQVVKGPPELTGACVAAVSNWKFKPARQKGAPISVVRQARFPFRIKT